MLSGRVCSRLSSASRVRSVTYPSVLFSDPCNQQTKASHMSDTKKRKLESTSNAVQAAVSDPENPKTRAKIQSSSSFKVGHCMLLQQMQARVPCNHTTALCQNICEVLIVRLHWPPVQVPGLLVTDHLFKVPLDYSGETAGEIDLFVRELVSPNNARRQQPYLLYLQGMFHPAHPLPGVAATSHSSVNLLSCIWDGSQ